MVPSPEPPDDSSSGGSDESSGSRVWDEMSERPADGPARSNGSPAEESPGSSAESDAGDLVISVLRRGLALVTAFSLGGFGFLLVVPFFLVGSLLLLVFGLDSPAARLVLGLISLQGIAFPLVALGYLGFRYGLERLLDRDLDLEFVRVRVPTLGDVGWTVLGLIGVVGLVFGALVVVSLLNAPTAQRSDQDVLFSNPELLLLLIPASFLLIAPGEELLFRGIVQDRLRESFSTVSAIVLASAAFAPAHLLALEGGLQALATTVGVLFVPSLVFGATYELTDNILVPIAIHGTYNALIFGSMYATIAFGGSQAVAVTVATLL